MTDYDDALREAKRACGRADYELGKDDGTYSVEYPEVNEALQALHGLLEVIEAQEAVDDALQARLKRIVDEIELTMDCTVKIGSGRKGPYLQIECYRRDVITGEMGYGRGGKAYPSPHATDSEIIQMIFGLFLSYWTHEAREGFEWDGRRVFGPHIKTQALHSVARQVDVRSAKHVEDQEPPGPGEAGYDEAEFEAHVRKKYDIRPKDEAEAPKVIVPMNARQQVLAMTAGNTPADGDGRELTKNAKGEWVNEIGDTPCPNDGEMVNKKCWQCGWVRDA